MHALKLLSLCFAMLFLMDAVDCNAQELTPPASPAKLKSGGNEDAPKLKLITTFGHRQLEQLLDDRPDMKGVIPKKHPVRKKIIDGFNGKLIGQRVYWVDLNPETAMHLQPYGDYPPFIAITDNPNTSPIDKWSSLLFEVYNLEGNFNELWDAALNGKIDRESYVKKCVALEDVAAEKTRAFFTKHPLPATKADTFYNFYFSEEGLKTHSLYRLLGTEIDNTKIFSEEYDDRIAPFLSR